MRRVTDLPTHPATLATYGDVLLADALAQAAWADWRAGRMSSDEVFHWQEIHRMTLRGYLRLIVGGADADHSDGGAAGGVGGAGADRAVRGERGMDRPADLVTCPRCGTPLLGDWCGYCRWSVDYRVHSPMIPQAGPGLNTSGGP